MAELAQPFRRLGADRTGSDDGAGLGSRRVRVLVAEDARTLADRVAEDLCQMITSRDQRVMVLMLTAAAAPQDRVAGLGLGADDYLTKPFHFPELVLRGLPHRQPRRVNLLPDDSGRC